MDVPTTFDSGLPDQIICGDVDSLSPFAVGFYTFDVSGPFPPIDSQPTRNTMKAGRSVPVKFSLGGDFGPAVFASGYPASQTISCDSGRPDRRRRGDHVEPLGPDLRQHLRDLYVQLEDAEPGRARAGP